MISNVRVRFAPSPTGSLHLGGLRTALYNYLTAKKLGGTFTLRIEDTDRTRLVPGSAADIIAGLRWAGIDFDYGPEKGGPDGPYLQSERLDLYHHHAKRLLDSGKAYHCFCTPEQLTEKRQKLLRIRSNATYDKTCSHLSEEEVARRLKAGQKHVIRFNDLTVPQRRDVEDIVFGNIDVGHGSLPTDTILIKSDRYPTYHLASVVDDHEMKITHVIRGEEWLQSLPLHLDLYSSLDLQPPRFGHLPLLLNPDGSKMSKRKGDVQVTDYIDKGWESAAVINWLALAGWGNSPAITEGDISPAQSDGTMTMDELIAKFNLESLTHRRTILDPGKLTHLNKQHLAKNINRVSADSDPDVIARARSFLRASHSQAETVDDEYVDKVVRALLPRISILSDLSDSETSSYFFQRPDLGTSAAKALRLSVKGPTYVAALNMSDGWIKQRKDDLTMTADLIRDSLRERHAENSQMITQKDFMNALRHALSGCKTGPSVPEIISVLGIPETQARIDDALAFEQIAVLESP